MRKFAILFIVAAMLLTSLGCRVVGPTIGEKWGLPDNDKATVVDGVMGYSTREDGCDEVYAVELEYRGHNTWVHVLKETFEAVEDGDAADIELIAVKYDWFSKEITETFYYWKVGKRKYEVRFDYVAEKE